MERLKFLVKYLISNFSPLIFFYVFNHFFGLKLAIAASVAVTLAEVIHFKIKKERLSRFFIFSAGIALIFGIIDLYLKEPIFFKYEAGLINLLFAFFFGFSIFTGKPIVQEFAENQGRVSVEPSPDKTFFFKVFTVFWTLYFLAKAGAYTWLNLQKSIDEALLFRILIGNISLGIMLFISIGLSRPIWQLFILLKIMPSARNLRGTQKFFS